MTSKNIYPSQLAKVTLEPKKTDSRLGIHWRRERERKEFTCALIIPWRAPTNTVFLGSRRGEG